MNTDVPNAEGMLYRYGSLNRRIDECKKNIRRLVAEKYACMDRQLRATVQKSRDNFMQKIVDMYDTRLARMTEDIQELYTEFDKLQKWISAAELNDEEREYIRLRYVKKIPIADIADLIGYSERQTQRIRKRIIKKITAALKPQ